MCSTANNREKCDHSGLNDMIVCERSRNKDSNTLQCSLHVGFLSCFRFRFRERIERFIDENKALMKRMYGEFTMSTEYGPPSRETYDQPGKRNVKREATGEGGGGSSSGDGGGGGGGGGAQDGKKKSMPPGVPDIHTVPGPDPVADTGSNGGESYFSKLRHTRQSFRNNQSSESGR